MASNSTFSRDIATLAERERAHLGKPPGMEELAALHDGVLSDSEAERVREWLTVDPELAATYLELQRLPNLDSSAVEPTPGFDTDADVEAAWGALSAKLEGGGTPPTVDTNVVRFSRPSLRRALVGLAAMLIGGLGAGWWLTLNEAKLPDEHYHLVTVTDEIYRGGTVTVPTEAVGIQFEIALEQPESGGEISVELLDSKGRRIRVRQITFEAGQVSVYFRVTKSDLLDEGAYEILLGPPAESSGQPFIFRVSLD